MRLENKVAIITGSSSGIGYAVADKYLSEGAKVVVCGLNPKDTKNAVDKLSLKYDINNILGVTVNVKNTSDIENLFNETINKFGKLDILVNNAGIAPAKPLDLMTDEEWDNTISINLTGAFKCTREAFKYMKETGGSIINTSSFVSLYGSPTQASYSASKAGLNGLTKSNAKELGKFGIRVNAVAPGVVMTDMVKETTNDQVIERLNMMTPVGRASQVSDLVGIYVYLASDESLTTTGTIINIDGGLVM